LKIALGQAQPEHPDELNLLEILEIKKKTQKKKTICFTKE